MIETERKYHPRTQKAALAYTAKQTNTVTARIERYFKARVFDRMTQLERDLVGTVSYEYHKWFSRTLWSYAAMNQFGRMEKLWTNVYVDIYRCFGDLMDLSARFLSTAYTLGYAGFLYQADSLTPPNVRVKAKLDRDGIARRLDQPWSAERGGGSSRAERLSHRADQLLRDLQRTLEQSMLQGESLQDALSRIKVVFGSETKRHVGESNRLIESEDLIDPSPYSQNYPEGLTVTMGGSGSPVQGFIDQGAWDEAMADLQATMDWEHRKRGYFTPDGGSAYDAERSLMTDYSRMVRAGQIDAQMPNGEVIKDFVWQTAIGPNTCQDCLDRHDMTMTDIAEKFGDDSAPPLHPSCNCALIPYLPDWQPLAGRWADDGTDRTLIDPETGARVAVPVEDFETWLANLE